MSRGEERRVGRAHAAIEIRKAAPGDLSAVLGLLAEASLPREGVTEHFTHFLVARAGDTVVGSVGLEPYGSSALLRSLVVTRDHQGRGLGRALTERLLEEARARGVKRVFLLTETAPDFFAAVGFRRIERDATDAAVRESVEFRTVCCQTAVCMRRDL